MMNIFCRRHEFLSFSLTNDCTKYSQDHGVAHLDSFNRRDAHLVCFLFLFYKNEIEKIKVVA
jgi:hypothetical protein